MATPARRVAAPPPPPPAPVVASGPNFLDLGFYTGGFTLPKGRWCMFFDVVMHSATKADGTPYGKPRLGVMTSCYNLDRPNEDPAEQFFSMGSKADLSFAPNESGKGLAVVPNAPASTAPRNTNWNLFLKSLYDAGMPPGLATNDLSIIDGIWVVTDQVPEPEERKGYAAQAATGEAGEQQQERKGSGLTVVVTEIIDGGKPWEGGGGVPQQAPAAKPAAVARQAPARPVAVAPPAAPVEAAPGDAEDTETAVISGISSVLEVEPNGTTKLKVRTGTFKYLNAKGHGAVASEAINTYFSSDDALNNVLGALGYKVSGANVVPATA